MMPRGSNKFNVKDNVNIIIDGNSIYTDAFGLPTIAQVLAANPYFEGSGATFVNRAVSGLSWYELRSRIETIVSDYVPGKRNILIVGETTNSVQAQNKTGEQSWDDCILYANRLKEFQPGPLDTILCSSLPLYSTNPIRDNPRLRAFDRLAGTFYKQINFSRFVNYRLKGPFAIQGENFSDYGVAAAPDFATYQSHWEDFFIHPNTPGKRVMCDSILQALKGL